MRWNKIDWDAISNFNDEHDENEDIDWGKIVPALFLSSGLPTNDKAIYLLREKMDSGDYHYWIGMYEPDFSMPYFYDPEMVNDSEITDNYFYPEAWVEITNEDI